MTIGCLTITIDRIGGIEASATRVSVPTNATATRVGGMTVTATRVGGMTATATRVGGMAVNMGLVCGPSLGVGTILWAYDAKLITIDNGYLLVNEI